MRTAAVLLIILSACELQPPPKKQPPAAAETPPPPPAKPPTPPPDVTDAGVDAPVAPPPIQASQDCINVAAHVVQVFIDTAKDPAQAAVYEQERMKMTRATAEACERQQWSTPAQKCYMGAKDPKAIKACENKFPPPAAPGSDAGSAKGSAAAPVMGGSAAGSGGMRPEGARH